MRSLVSRDSVVARARVAAGVGLGFGGGVACGVAVGVALGLSVGRGVVEGSAAGADGTAKAVSVGAAARSLVGREVASRTAPVGERAWVTASTTIRLAPTRTRTADVSRQRRS